MGIQIGNLKKAGYPALPKTELFEVEIEKMTGKFSEAFSH